MMNSKAFLSAAFSAMGIRPVAVNTLSANVPVLRWRPADLAQRSVASHGAEWTPGGLLVEEVQQLLADRGHLAFHNRSVDKVLASRGYGTASVVEGEMASVSEQLLHFLDQQSPPGVHSAPWLATLLCARSAGRQRSTGKCSPTTYSLQPAGCPWPKMPPTRKPSSSSSGTFARPRRRLRVA